MRSAQKNNRSRGRSNRKGGGGGGGGGNIINRVYDSAGPEGKVRGTPQQIIEKYLSLARDAQTTGDRVMSENFLQHAEHYQRLLMQATAQQEQNRQSQAESGQDSDGEDGDSRDNRDVRDNREQGQGDRRPAQQPEPQQSEPQQSEPQQRNGGEDEASDTDEIGGMTTIDSGSSGGDDLLVVPEETAKSQPRRNGDGRRRRQRRDPETPTEGGNDAEQPAPVQQEN